MLISKSATAKMLGITRPTLDKMIKNNLIKYKRFASNKYEIVKFDSDYIEELIKTREKIIGGRNGL